MRLSFAAAGVDQTGTFAHQAATDRLRQVQPFRPLRGLSDLRSCRS